MSGPAVLGLDVGGTSTRVAVVTGDGDRIGSGRAGGGNPTTHGADAAATQLRAALAEALASIDAARVRAAVIGLAGAGRLAADPDSRAAFDRVWREVGLRCPYTLVGDQLVAYASATAAPDGTILVAGTGAIASHVHDLDLIRSADGHGWLLGDAGSGFWLGREAVRHALTDLDSHRELAPISQLVCAELLGAPRPQEPPRKIVDALVQAVTRRPPVWLARLAPLVIQAHDAGDEAARSIIARAAEHLVTSVARIRPPDACSPIVLGGGLLTGDTPLTRAVAERLSARWPHAPQLTAGDGALGAAWLAARALPEVADPAALHRRLFGRAAG